MTKKPSYQELEERVNYLETILQQYNQSDTFLSQKFDPILNKDADYEPPYGDVTELNTCRLIMDSVGKETLKAIAEDAIDLLKLLCFQLRIMRMAE